MTPFCKCLDMDINQSREKGSAASIKRKDEKCWHGIKRSIWSLLWMFWLGIWTRWVVQNHTRGWSISEVNPAVNDSWLWKSLVHVLNDFQVNFDEKSGGGLTLDWDSFVTGNGSMNCQEVYDIFSTRGEYKECGCFLKKQEEDNPVCWINSARTRGIYVQP